jgi:uncharacterized protein YdaU (DUF1376 family)
VNRLPWYKRFPAEYLAVASDLSLTEEGALLRMRDWTWSNGPLPDNAKTVARLIREPRREKLVAELLNRFFKLTDEGYIDEDLERQRRHATETSGKRRVAGRAGANARWDPESGEEANAGGMADCMAIGMRPPMANAIKPPMANAIRPPMANATVRASGSPTGIESNSEVDNGVGETYAPPERPAGRRR